MGLRLLNGSMPWLAAGFVVLFCTPLSAWQTTDGAASSSAGAAPREASAPPRSFSPPRAESSPAPAAATPRRGPIVSIAPEAQRSDVPLDDNMKPGEDKSQPGVANEPAAKPVEANNPADKNEPAPDDDAPAQKTPRPQAPPFADAGASLLLDEVFAVKLDDPPPYPATAVEVGGFQGVQPGVATLDDVTRQWGEGRKLAGADGETVRTYKVDAFPRIDATFRDEKVQSIVIYLGQPAPADALAHQLNLDDVRAVQVPDEAGELLGQAYPERGVIFGFAPGSNKVAHVMLEKIDLEAFVLRAEMLRNIECRSSMADVGYVLSQDPRHARALWIKAELLAGADRSDEALAAIDEAVDIDADDANYQLSRARILALAGQHDAAVEATKEVLQREKLADELRARALCQLGDLLAQYPSNDYKAAMEQHLASIELADKLSVDKRASVRRAAKEVLINAHLAVANDVARGFWQQKERVAPKWLDRAKAYAEDLISKENGDPEVMLRVAAGALSVAAGVEGKIDPVPWTRLALAQGKHLIASTDDAWRRRRLEWQLGTALFDSLTADDLRRDNRHSLTNSTLTVTYLEQGAQARAATPENVFLLGRMYYRVGSLHAVQRRDHATAVTWYEKAVPLLNRPLPPAHADLRGRYGEWLVSMGISFWEVGRRDEALRLTDEGTRHVEEAVGKELLDRQALVVPYSNLSAMHRDLGNLTKARDFEEMAAKIEGPMRR